MDLLRHLECFVVVGEELHFGRAAQRLLMAQPALSQRIRRLEKELGVVLLERSPRRVAPTPAGRLVLAEARELLAARDRLMTVAAGAARDADSTVRVAVPVGGPPGLVSALLSAVSERLPDVRLHLTEADGAQAARALFDGTLDAAVLAGPVAPARLTVRSTLACPLGILLPAAHDLAARAEVHLADLGSATLVLMPTESAEPVHRTVVATCRRHGAAPREVVPTRQAELALALVAAGSAVALTAATETGADAVWRPIVGEPLLRTLSLVTGPSGGLRICAITADALRDGLGYRPPPETRAYATDLPRPSSGFLT